MHLALTLPAAAALSFFLVAPVNAKSKPSRQSSGSATVVTQCTVPGTIALTFDDGPYKWENTVSKQLTAANITGSFFVNGYNYDCIYSPDYVTKIQKTYAQGHMIGSHTWNHRDITKLTDAEFEQQLDLLETALKKILGIKPKWFRPPYGDYNEGNLKVLAKRGYNVAMWGFDSGDSTGSTAAESNKAYDALAKSHPNPGPVCLNHETLQTTAKEVVPHAIKVLQKAGYKLVSLAECVGDSKPYQWVGKPSARDNTWTCDGTPKPYAN